MQFVSSEIAITSKIFAKFMVYGALTVHAFCAIAQGETRPQADDLSKSKIAAVFGQVFVVTQGSQNIKLALVTISAFPEKGFYGVKAKTLKIQQDLKEIALKKIDAARAEMDAAQRNLSVTERELANASALWKSVNFMVGTDEEKYYKAVLARNEANEHTVDLVNETVRNEEAILAEIGTPKFALVALGESKYSAKSDADGRFGMKLPRGVYVFTAKATRKVLDTSEEYLWLIKVDLTKGDKDVMLSNDNMIGINCGECIQPPLL